MKLPKEGSKVQFSVYVRNVLTTGHYECRVWNSETKTGQDTIYLHPGTFSEETQNNISVSAGDLKKVWGTVQPHPKPDEYLFVHVFDDPNNRIKINWLLVDPSDEDKEREAKAAEEARIKQEAEMRAKIEKEMREKIEAEAAEKAKAEADSKTKTPAGAK